MELNVRIAVDAMGGDYAPSEIIAGALMAQAKFDIDILLVGDETVITAYFKQHHHKLGDRIQIIPAEGQIDMHEEPLEALRRKPKSSIAVSMEMVKQKKADGVVAAGHTGAAMAAALLRLGRLKGIDRPAIGALLPTLIPHKPVLLLDVGANVDCRPKFLEQFAMMGLLYSRYALGVKNPKLGLLNIGEEPSKGNDLAIKVHQSLQDNPQIPFSGNAEGRDVMSGEFDVVICDGFMGNVLLKFAEGVGKVAMQILKEELPRGWWGKLGVLFLRPNLSQVKQRMDYNEYGGALLLGVDGVCIITHGSSKASGICNAIRVAKDAIENEVLDRIRTQIKELNAVTE